jgi:hypothetical protein
VLVIGLVAVVLVLAVTVGALARGQGARAGVRTAADLAALAAATSIAVPSGVVLPAGGPAAEPCALAGEVALRNGAAITRCAVLREGVVEVTASRPALTGAATATARAGPRTARP